MRLFLTADMNHDQLVPVVLVTGSHAKIMSTSLTPKFFEIKESMQTFVPVGTYVQDNALNQFMLSDNLNAQQVSNLLDQGLSENLLTVDMPIGSVIELYSSNYVEKTQSIIKIMPSVGTIVKFLPGTKMTNVATNQSHITDDPNVCYLLYV
jgi:hypothetical protein